jgi:N-acetylneuraminate epimerase
LFAQPVAAFSAPLLEQSMTWSQLPPMPDGEGFAGTFAGVSGGALVVAGGANMVGDRWANPFQKQWHDGIFILEEPTGQWFVGPKLPRPLAYGVSITTGDGLICIGGSDSTQHSAEVFRLQWKAGEVHYSALPKLPKACANACGALVGRTIYIAGGLETPSATAALKTFWAMDLSETPLIWRELEPWPGPARMLAIAAASNDAFFLLSGCDLTPKEGGGVVRKYHRDAYRFIAGRGWTRLADLPRAAVAAASPAPFLGESELLLLSGDDGLHVDFSPIEEHPGFPMDILAYDLSTDHWRSAASLPFSRVTVPAVAWKGRTVLPSGEVRPRVRTPQVWTLEMKGR